MTNTKQNRAKAAQGLVNVISLPSEFQPTMEIVCRRLSRDCIVVLVITLIGVITSMVLMLMDWLA